MRRSLTVVALFAIILIAPTGAQYPTVHPCDVGPVYAGWCHDGTQDLCTAFHVGPVYRNPYGVEQRFDFVYWSDAYGAWMLHGRVLDEPSYEIDVFDGTRQYPYCEL